MLLIEPNRSGLKVVASIVVQTDVSQQQRKSSCECMLYFDDDTFMGEVWPKGNHTKVLFFVSALFWRSIISVSAGPRSFSFPNDF
jgi:hypothetical protein